MFALLAPLVLLAPAVVAAGGALTCTVPEGPARATLDTRDGRHIVARDGALQIGDKTLTVCDGLPGGFPTALAESAGPSDKPEVFVGFRQEGLWRWDARGFTAVGGLTPEARAGGVRAVVASGDGLWVATGTAGLLHLDAKGLVTATEHKVVASQPALALRAEPGGAVRGAFGPYGTFKIDPPAAGGRLRIQRTDRGYAGCFERDGRPAVYCESGGAPLARASGLPSSHLTALATFQGRLYAGTFDRGLAVSTDGTHFASVPGVPPFVNALAASGPGLTPAGETERVARSCPPAPRTAASRRPASWGPQPVGAVPRYSPYQFCHPHSLADGRIGPLASASNSGRPSEAALYIGTARGLYVFNESAEPARLVPGLADHVNGLAVSSTGALAVATSRGAYVLDGGVLHHLGEAEGLPSRLAWAVGWEPSGALWVGTADGLSRFAQGLPPETFLRGTGHLTHDWVTAVLPDATGVTVGTYDAGVIRLTPDAAASRGHHAEILETTAWVNPGGLVRLGGDLVVLTLGGGAGPLEGGAMRGVLPASLNDVTAAVEFQHRWYFATRAGLVHGPQGWYHAGHEVHTPTKLSATLGHSPGTLAGVGLRDGGAR